jgi:Rrf2 family iron-sulfur cluster assembly transcriptional regulator
MLVAMRLSLQVQYAICGIFDLAYNGQDAPVQLRVISERQSIPTRYLEQIFQRLRRAQLVTAKRGPGGGYALARSSAAITLRDIVEAVEGPLAEALEMPPPETGDATLRPRFLWAELAQRFDQVLEALSLEELCREAARAAVERASPTAPMYFI